MTSSVVRKLTPQERALAQKKRQLAALESQLAQRELDLATLYAEVRAYDRAFLTPISLKRAELQEVEAEIAAVLAEQNPQDLEAQERARELFEQAAEWAERSNKTRAESAAETFEADEDTRALFRQAAKKFHPDLAHDENDRERRNAIMAQINRAYQEGDASALRVIIDRSETEPEVIAREGVGAYLARVERMIARVQTRLQEIESLMKKGARIHRTMPRGEQEKQTFDAQVAEACEKLDRAIARARKRLDGLKRQAP